ncbi:DUF488 domain-containing protein [Kushneria phosphatilytica]|uniref:DUF488 family protein n=1 Tax=Kushneria phosphatilytica TaxID=657387 RepID=A0A1S1NRA8_9GAMM|nr:DUF488 family protein [Kushneria phosphatilytica]OHV07594.1 hypothetical protein BH688_15390 [Kushneria phosphatilytica]QEL10080.1 DUF488 family protein [Kushneria phosphatilytica]
MNIQLKRIYDPYDRNDGYRVLVDGMWPRGVAKEDAHIDEWYRDIAPSKGLVKWFGHDRDRWHGFYEAYRRELRERDSTLSQTLREHARNEGLTLLFAAKDEECNNAVVLRDFLKRTH